MIKIKVVKIVDINGDKILSTSRPTRRFYSSNSRQGSTCEWFKKEYDEGAKEDKNTPIN